MENKAKTKKEPRSKVYEELIKLRTEIKNKFDKAYDKINSILRCKSVYAFPNREAEVLVLEDFIEIFNEICFWFISGQSPLENTKKVLEKLSDELTETRKEKEETTIETHLKFLDGRAKALETAIECTKKVIKLFENMEVSK